MEMTLELYAFCGVCFIVGATHLALYIEDRIRDKFDRD